jgi:hypothetical protein
LTVVDPNRRPPVSNAMRHRVIVVAHLAACIAVDVASNALFIYEQTVEKLSVIKKESLGSLHV